MFTFVCLLILASPIAAGVRKQVTTYCSPTEFACSDLGCITADQVCDGNIDCPDGLDEDACEMDLLTDLTHEPVINRSRRQASRCRKDQWACRDGSCISFDGKCDGIVDCTDGSDETHALCRENICQHNWFRCTYGACVDGTAPCNGAQECADNSDELLPRCRNETDVVRGQFRCLDGSTIPATGHCDGIKDCTDGSDETVRSCAAKTCPSHFFQCAYGACVDSGANCNQVQDCADGSDEAAELCDKSGTAAVTPIKPQKGNCVLPAYPEHGTYVTNIPNGRPGESYDFLAINVTCRQGYEVDGPKSVSCYNGWWPDPLPKCVSVCRLMPHPSVEYNCILTGINGVSGTRPCREYEPDGTQVDPKCRTPNYYSPISLRLMRCSNGIWDYVAICSPGLTKNGTNITILIKDTVEVHISDIEYVVPVNSSQVKPVVPITNNDFIYSSLIPNYLSIYNATTTRTANKVTSNIPDYIPTSRPTNKPITNKPITNKPTSKPSDNYNDNQVTDIFNKVTEKPYDNTINIGNDKTDVSDEYSEIDIIDWRMGVPDNRSSKIPTKSTNPNINNRKKKNSYINQNSFSSAVYRAITPAPDDSDELFSIDVRFSNSNSNEKISSTSITSNPTKVDDAKLYTSKSNNTNIYFNITNSSVNVHADGKLVFEN